MPTPKRHTFKAETQKVLSILTHSLYTNKEIFLRELLSNASDALDKLRFMQSRGESIRDDGLPLEIRIKIDKEAGVLEVADTGLGMTAAELVENLGTIAKSGSEEFLEGIKAEGEEAEGGSVPSAAEIIGRFGIGFYSVFMVADEVEVISVPAFGDEKGSVWSSTGAGSFTIEPLADERVGLFGRGTVVRAKLTKEAGEYLEKYRLESVIRKHSNFLPFPILLEGERVNTSPALWREPRFSITREQYSEFYASFADDDKPPLDVIHLAVDAPVQFSALIFIPDSEQDLFRNRRDDWGLALYVRRVLIDRTCSDLIPQYLGFLKGVVDTEDLPLNISRESLQENAVLRKMEQTIVKQVFGHIEKMAESEPEKYETFWRLHGRYFKFAFDDFVNRDRVAPLMRFKSSTTEGLTSLDQYLARAKDGQKEIWHLGAPSVEAAMVNPHMERFNRKGIEVLCLPDPVDGFALDSIGAYKGHPFKSVEQAGAKDLESFTETDAQPAPEALSEEEKGDFDKLVARMKVILGDRVEDVSISDRLAGSPAVLVLPGGLNSSMEKLIRVMQNNESVPKKVLEVNPAHPMMRVFMQICAEDEKNPLLDEFVNSLFDNLLLLDGYLTDPHLLADRNLKLMGKAAAWYSGDKR